MAIFASTIRDDFLRTLDHVDAAFGKLVANSGPGRPLTFPDLHKTTEGLFLSAWTYWEQFVRELFQFELAMDPAGKLCREVKPTGFRLKKSSIRLAELVTEHLDEGKWFEWTSIDTVRERANRLLAAGNRFSLLTNAELDEIRSLKKVRNAVAHKSDMAWRGFRALVQKAPYSLAAVSLKGLTTGRFLSAHKVGGIVVLTRFVQGLRNAAQTMVPEKAITD